MSGPKKTGDATEENREKWIWSPSQLKALDFCPYQFYLKYVKKVEAPIPEIIQDGLRIHDEIFSDIKNGTSNNPVSDIIKKHLSGKKVEIEPRVELVQVIDGIPARIRGLPDIVTEDEIYDLKTTSERLIDRVSRGDRAQMTLYSLATGKPTKVVKIPREGHEYVNIHEVPLDKDFLGRVPELIRQGRRILAGEIPKPNTRACRYCYMREVCPFGGGDNAE